MVLRCPDNRVTTGAWKCTKLSNVTHCLTDALTLSLSHSFMLALNMCREDNMRLRGGYDGCWTRVAFHITSGR